MNVFVNTTRGLSPAMDRIVSKLIRYTPSTFRIVDDVNDADLVVLHVVRHDETIDNIRKLVSVNKKYVIIQYMLRTTEKPDTHDWLPIWAGAELVWSYYDLQELCKEDGVEFPSNTMFYYAPLGVDSRIFNEGFKPGKYPYKVLTTGTLAPTETIDLVNEACGAVDGKHMHLGILEEKPSGFDESVVEYEYGATDVRLAQLYRQAEYVSGLRRLEGFELPAAEALLCGTIPILYDKPHYRVWYGDLGALFITEGSDEEIKTQLVEILSHEPGYWPKPDSHKAKKRFDWQNICQTFWDALRQKKMEHVVVQEPVRRLLWVGDAVAATGFSRATHHILETLQKTWEVYVLGLNYFGDPHIYPYKIFPAKNGGDPFGIGRLRSLVEALRPEFVVIQNDPWNFKSYLDVMDDTPVVGIVAVDGLNCRGNELNRLRHAIFWTKFGATEAARGGYEGTSTVIPLGVDLNIYKPMGKQEARDAMGLPSKVRDAFIVGNVNRNQPRKRLDLTIQYFCEWIKTYRIDDAYLYLHLAPTVEQGYDIRQLMGYYGVRDRLIRAVPEIMYGIEETRLADTYNCFDVQASTTQGEGFGLTTLEGMACAVPPIVPEWAALGDLFYGSVELIPCSTMAATPNEINVIGGIPDKALFIAALHKMYKDQRYRFQRQTQAFDKANDPQFRWNNIGQRYVETLESLSVRETVNA